MNIVSYILFVLILTISISIKSQASATDLADNQLVYWFFIKADIKTDKEIKTPVYKVKRLGKDVNSGSFEKYKKEVWRYIKAGNQLTIGPFLQINDAKKANEHMI